MWAGASSIAGMSAAKSPAAEPLPGDDVVAPVLSSLTPHYSEPDHGLYVRILRDTIDGDAAVRNIALTGAYGSGKSSVLEPLERIYPGRVVTVSLSSLSAADTAEAPANPNNPAASSPTNRIQREIVKQLLYRLPPEKTSESRFPRITRPPIRRELRDAVIAGVVAVAVCYLFGWPSAFAVGSDVPWWRTLLVNGAIGASVGFVAWWVQRFLRGRMQVDSVKAGPATITLSARSTSYFDEYLDEIVYFFEVSKCNIVVLEDLDRFEDPAIFETLRALNTLLNRTEQLKERWPIRFIYAARDSILEATGPGAKKPDDAAGNPAATDLAGGVERANRTKFFDLVIPVVPFITHRNARDLLGKEMAEWDEAIPRQLVNLVARRVADMRLILNIHNEFEIFRRRLLDVEHPMPGLDPAHLFAIVAYKNVAPRDFENIRLQCSALDVLHNRWRTLVDASLTSNQQAVAATSTATELGARLLQAAQAMLEQRPPGGGSGTRPVQLQLGGEPVTPAYVQSVEFWQRVIDGEMAQVLVGGQPTSQLDGGRLEAVVRHKLDPQAWGRDDAERAERLRIRSVADLEFLRHHEWAQIYARPEFTATLSGVGDGKPSSFAAIVDETLARIPLARDLVEAGYLDRHFALYAAAFHGRLLRPGAMEYVMRYVERGEPGTLHPLDDADVEAILADWGAGVLADRSMRNVSVMDHLLAMRPADVATVLNGLLAWRQGEHEFVSAYLVQGRDAVGFVSALVGLLPSVFVYLVNEAPIDEQRRTTLVDAALRGAKSGLQYVADEAVGAYLVEHYRQFSALKSPGTKERARVAVGVLGQYGVQLPTTGDLALATRDALVDARAYELNASNLATLAGGKDFALDVLRTNDRRVYERATGDLRSYLDAVDASRGRVHTVNSDKAFVAILNDIGDDELGSEVVRGATRECVVMDIEDVPTNLWPELAADNHMACTTSNISAYLQEEGDELDAPLAELLKTHRTITPDDQTDQAARLQLATMILNARPGRLDAKLRVRLVVSLKLDVGVPAAAIRPPRGELVGLLIKQKVIADDTDAFAPALMPDWETREAAILASRAFGSFLAPAYLPTGEVADFLLSKGIAAGLKQSVVDELPAYLTKATREQARRIAVALLAQGFEVDPAGMEALRAAGAPMSGLIALTATSLGRFDNGDLVGLLTAMGGQYARTVDVGGSRVIYLTDDEAHRVVLDRLVSAGIVHHHEPHDTLTHPNTRKVTLFRRA